MQTIEKEKEVQVLQALMQGEEKERIRIAYTLHDEVSGMLAAAKMYVNTLAPVLSDASGYHKLVGLLDESSSRLRNMAHHLLPEVLMQNGLEFALQKYCKSIGSSETLSIDFYSLSSVGRYPHNFELGIYRIVQELLNNIIKHARASAVFVQMGVEERMLFVTVEDNGVGLDVKKSSDGVGLMSLERRVRALNGKMDISAEEGVGTSVYLEFETEKPQ